VTTRRDVGSDSSAPLHRERVADRIVDALRERIANGTYARGGRLPTERELAQSFGVSAPTVREALRALTSLGLVEVRHGSGAYVTRSPQRMIDAALGLVVQMENVGVEELVGILRVLNLYVAESAIDRCDERDIESMRAAATATADAESPEAMVAAVKQFLLSYVATARQPLLDALCGFLVSALIEIEQNSLVSRPKKFWAEWGRSTAPLRHGVVDAIEAGDPDALVQAVGLLHDQIRKRIAGVPGLTTATLSRATESR
jgi:GntR family transcriptional repressor for pyruvate dehydrogenase complex